MASPLDFFYLELLETLLATARLTEFTDYESDIDPFASEGSTIEVVYRHRQHHSFKIVEGSSSNTVYYRNGRPSFFNEGPMDNQKALQWLRGWVQDIERDIQLRSRLRELRNMSSQFKETTEKFSSVKDTPPTREELDEIFRILDNLQSSMLDQLKQQELKDEEMETEINRLKMQIEALKSQAETSMSIRDVLGSMMQRFGKYLTPENAQKVIDAVSDTKLLE